MPDTFGRALWLRSIKAAEMASGQPIPGLMPWDRPEKMAAPPKGRHRCQIGHHLDGRIAQAVG